MAIWEKKAPRRILTQKRLIRWTNNLVLTALNSFLVYLVFPVAAAGAAIFAEKTDWGLLRIIDLPVWLEGIIAIILLDLVIYTQHYLFHTIPLFWRIHKMHHTDLDIDVTTGARFHPFEIFLSAGIKIGVVILIGAPAWVVIVFEILLNATSMFNHSDAYIPLHADSFLRLLVVTPDMHRVHHSAIIKETNSNYGFNFPWWDRLFKTYRAQPQKGHLDMTIGLANYRDTKWLTLPWMLLVPFMSRER